LTALNLANNNLSGEFPGLSKFPQLSSLDLTSNDLLTGTLSLKKDSILDKDANADITDDASETPGFSPASIAVISIAIALVIFLVCGLFAYQFYFEDIIKARKRRQRHDESSELQSTGNKNLPGFSMAPRTSVAIPLVMMKVMGMKSLRITKQISKGGFGYVYEGVYEGRAVAVKRIIVPSEKRDKLRLAVMFSKSFLRANAIQPKKRQ
jgi:hypothetical protein